MLASKYSLDYVSDIELESINNFTMKESMEIIIEEVDYFFDGKESLVDILIEGIQLEKLDLKNLQERFYRVLYSPEDIERFMIRLEKRITRELARVQSPVSFRLPKELDNLSNFKDSFNLIAEEIKTLKLSCSTAKGIDLIWKKSGKCFLPAGMNKFSAKIKMGDHFLSAVGLSPKEIKASIYHKMSKRIRGILKQDRHDMISQLKHEIFMQVVNQEKSMPGIVGLEKIRTA